MFCAVSRAKSPRTVPGGRLVRSGRAVDGADHGDRVRPVEGERHQRRGGHELDQAAEERLGAVGRVVALGQAAIDLDELQPDQPKAAILVAGEDPADKLALDAVGLDEDEGPFSAWHVFLGYGCAGRAGLYRMRVADPPRRLIGDGPGRRTTRLPPTPVAPRFRGRPA